MALLATSILFRSEDDFFFSGFVYIVSVTLHDDHAVLVLISICLLLLFQFDKASVFMELEMDSIQQG